MTDNHVYVKALEAVSSHKDKERIIRDAWTAGNSLFFQGFKLAYDPFTTFGVKKIPLIEGDNEFGFVPAFNWNEFVDLAGKLARRELTGNAAQKALLDAAERSDANEWNYFYRRILLKDMRCGVTDSKINDVLDEIIKNGDVAAEAYKIFIFECQLAKPADDNKKKLKGKKYLDFKLDGARLLTFMNKEEGTVRQFSRNGKENTNFSKITSQLATLLPQLTESIVLDGEIVGANFQTLMTKFSKDAKVTDDSAHLALFDVIRMVDFVKGRSDETQDDRHAKLSMMAGDFQRIGGLSYVIPKLLVDLDNEDGQKSFAEFNREAIALGYEGIMVKDPKAPYECKRSAAWLKIKPVISVSLELLDMNAGDPGTKYENVLGALVCGGTDEGKKIQVNVGSGLSDDDRVDFWARKAELIGLIVEIEADAITKDNSNDDVWSLRFPRFKGFRGSIPGEKV